MGEVLTTSEGAVAATAIDRIRRDFEKTPTEKWGAILCSIGAALCYLLLLVLLYFFVALLVWRDVFHHSPSSRLRRRKSSRLSGRRGQKTSGQRQWRASRLLRRRRSASPVLTSTRLQPLTN